MGVTFDKKKVAMAILDGLSPKYENIVTTLKALGDDNESNNLKTVRNSFLKEKQRREIKVKAYFDTVFFC